MSVISEAPWGGVTHAQIEELADRLMGRGMNGLTLDDWPTLVNILEAASVLRKALENSPAGLADAHSKSPSRPAMPKEEDTHG